MSRATLEQLEPNAFMTTPKTEYKYFITTSFRVLCLRNVRIEGSLIRAEENRVTSWESVTLPNTKLYNSIAEAYDQAIDDCDFCLRQLERMKGEEMDREIDNNP